MSNPTKQGSALNGKLMTLKKSSPWKWL